MEKILRILILEDYPSDADLMEDELRQAGFQYQVRRAMTEKDYLLALGDFCPHLILSDYELPRYNGALALTAAKSICPETPFILVTGAIGEDLAIEMLTSGAKDYVMKNRLHRLAPAVRRALAEVEERKARKRAEEELRETHKNLEMQVERRVAQLRREMDERRQVEEEKNRLAELVDASPASITVHDFEGNFLYANKKACTMHGYTREEFMNLNLARLDIPESISLIEERMRGIMEEKEMSFEVGHLRKDGSMLPLQVTARLSRWGEKKVIQSIATDITEQKRAEAALRTSEEFVRNILDTVDEGFIVIDRDFRILTANRAYCHGVGEAFDRVIGRRCYEVSHRTSRPCPEEGEECPVCHVFDTGLPHRALHKHMDAERNIIYVETKAFPIRDGSGKIISVIETINNITERHLLEEERLKSEKMAAIGTLAGGIAHDFNNLLQGVFGYVSMARMALDQKERALAMLEQAEKALHMSVNLTTQLLTFSKGGKPLKKTIDLRPVVENAVKFALSGSRVGYSITYEDDLPRVEADEGQIGQVIQNIVLNADQAMPHGGAAVITVKNVFIPKNNALKLPAEGGYVVLTVQDSGVGIPESLLPKIFDPYFTTKEKGSGLGLATSYSIINNHGGVIEVISEVGKGASFSVYLPAIETLTETPEALPGNNAVPQGKILVMDDEEMVRDVSAELIRALGHEVEVAENGEAALETYQAAMASARPFDLVILDLTIRGGMGGMEANDKLLALDSKAKTVVSSGYADNALLSEYKSRRFRACLKKPYRLEELKNVLNDLLNRPC